MNRDQAAVPTEGSSRNDRSRSPHRESLHPWDKMREPPKSVLYPADVQYFRQSQSSRFGSSKSRSKPTPGKPSQSRVSSECNQATRSDISPLKQSRSNQEQTASHQNRPYPDASLQRTAERMQRWTKAYSPPKFMAGLTPKDRDLETFAHNQTTPKGRVREPWTVEYFLSRPQRSEQGGKLDSEKTKKKKKKHHSEMNIQRMGKENRRTSSLDLNEADNDGEDSITMEGDVRRVLFDTSDGMVVDKVDDGDANSPMEKQTDPPVHDLEMSTFLTPETFTSPNDVFFTPMTHIRTPEKNMNFLSESQSSTLKFASSHQSPKFSLINMNASAPHSPFKRNASIKERTESQLEVFDRISSKLDTSIQNMRDLLSRPISFGLPSADASNIPAFTGSRQTIDISQLPSNWTRNTDVEVPSRHSLPVNCSVFGQTKQSEEALNLSLDKNVETYSDGHRSNINISPSVSTTPEKRQILKTGSSRVSLAKALGFSMAAELAYASRIEEAKEHLKAVRRLAESVTKKMDRVEMENADHVDKVLDTISLHDGSLVVLEGEQISDDPSDQRLCSPSMLPTMKSGKENGQSIATGSINRSELPRVGVGKGKLREELDSYFRMKRRLYDLQLVLLQLKKRSASTPKQAEKFEKLFKAASEDYRNAVNQASSWLERRVPQKELLKFIKTRQRQLWAETEECANTIKKFLNSEITSAQKNSEDACSFTNENTRLQNGRRDSAVRINTEALNKSVDCDIWNLSARSMRRNLEARREQAEILNRSFEEMSKDIEKRTKESIAAQIIQYDRVIAERADLITQLDRISSQDISTPRRDGVEPLDLAQLSSQASLSDDGRTSKSTLVASPVAANAQPTDQNEAEAGINCRSHSHSTVYEDSVSHLGDGDENESCQPCSEDTIFEDSQEKHVPDGFEKENPSRRTLDAAEILATLSHHVVIMPTSDSSKNDVEQSIGNVVEEIGSQKMAVNEATRFDSKREAPEAEKIMVGIDSDADAAILAKSVNIDDDKDQAEILPTLTNDERGSCGDASYTQENISVDVSFAEFHQSEAKGKLTITEKGGSLIVTSPVTVKEKRATDLSADLIPTSSPRSKVSQLELLSDGSHESTERSHSPQYQNYMQDTAMILGEAVHVTERIENADQTTETAAMFEEGDEKAIPNDFVSRGPIPAQKIHDLTRAEICDELSSSITQSLETTSPRRRSSLLERYRYELSESLLSDTLSSLPKSPSPPQERFMTKMPSSASPRHALPYEDNLETLIPRAIEQDTRRVLTDDVISEVDEVVAQIESRHPSAKYGNKSLHFTRPQDVLDESYEDLLSIEKPCSLFEKLSSTSSTKLTPELEVTEGLQKLEKYVEEVNSPEWMKEKCLYFSKEVWNTTKSRGFMRTMVDELTPVPGLEEDMVTLDENERVVVESKNTLIWSTVVELAAMLWPETSAKQTSISSKWLPIPKSFEEFAKMAERYVIEQFSDLSSSHRYTRLSRPWTSENSETPVETIVAQCLYGRDPNCVSFNRKVNAERRRLCEELIELVGDRYVLSEIEVTGTSSSSTFDRLSGEDGRPSLGCLFTNNARSVERRLSGGRTHVAAPNS